MTPISTMVRGPGSPLRHRSPPGRENDVIPGEESECYAAHRGRQVPPIVNGAQIALSCLAATGS